MRLQRQDARPWAGSAGKWLLPGQGLTLCRHRDVWRVHSTAQLDSLRWLSPQRSARWHYHRQQWLESHGLDRAEFARRRELLQALEYALQRDPLPGPSHP